MFAQNHITLNQCTTQNYTDCSVALYSVCIKQNHITLNQCTAQNYTDCSVALHNVCIKQNHITLNQCTIQNYTDCSVALHNVCLKQNHITLNQCTTQNYTDCSVALHNVCIKQNHITLNQHTSHNYANWLQCCLSQCWHQNHVTLNHPQPCTPADSLPFALRRVGYAEDRGAGDTVNTSLTMRCTCSTRSLKPCPAGHTLCRKSVERVAGKDLMNRAEILPDYELLRCHRNVSSGTRECVLAPGPACVRFAKLPVAKISSVKTPGLPSDTVVRQTDFDVTIGQCVVSDRNLSCAILIRHKTLSDVEVSLLPKQLCVLSHCRRTVPDGGSGS